MKKERLMELAGVQLNEALDQNKEFPVITITRKEVLDELEDYVLDAIADGELPEGSKLTMDILSDEIMENHAKLLVRVYESQGESARADNYIEAMDNTMKAAFKGKKK